MVNDFLQKAKENLKAAQSLFEQKLYNASANRSYYAAFQIALAKSSPPRASKAKKTAIAGFRQISAESSSRNASFIPGV